MSRKPVLVEDKLKSLLFDLKNAESKYIQELSVVSNEYMPYVKNRYSEEKLPFELSQKDFNILFSNVDKLYKWHLQIVHPSLNLSSVFRSISEFCKIIENDSYYLEMYTIFLINRSESLKIYKKFAGYFEKVKNQALNIEFTLDKYLEKPTERLPAYEKFLKNSYDSLTELKRIQEANDVKRAQDTIKNIKNTVNMEMASKNLRKVPKKIKESSLGDFIQVCQFKVYNDSILMLQKKKCLFLYKNYLIFTDIVKKEKVKYYEYFDHIKIFQLKVEKAKNSTELIFKEEKDNTDNKIGKQFIFTLINSKDQANFYMNIQRLVQEKLDFMDSVRDPQKNDLFN